MSLPVLTVTPASAAQTYGRIDAGADGGTESVSGPDFGSVLARAVDGAISSGKDAESRSIQAIGGHGSITDVVTAVSNADLALQTTVAIRDRVVQAYQDIMRMPI